MKARLVTKIVREIQPQERPFEVWDTELRGLLVRIQPTGIRTFYCTYRTRDGRRNRVRIGDAMIISVSTARDEAQKLLADVIRGLDPSMEKQKAKAQSFKKFLSERYGPWVVVHRKSGAITKRRLETCFEEFMERRLEDISAWLVEKWRSKRRQSNIQPATINRDIVALKAALSKAVEWGLLDHHPLSKVKPLKVDQLGIVRYLSSSEEMRLRDALKAREEAARLKRGTANAWRRSRGYPEKHEYGLDEFVDHLRPIVLLALNTGMRRGEMFQLQWQNVLLESKQIIVTAESTKTGNTRYIPLNTEALLVLETLWDHANQPKDGLVFPGKQEKVLNNFQKSWMAVLLKADVRNFRLHDCRHSFASKLVMVGVDLNTVRELLGHADLKMTLRYAHLAPHVKADAVSRLNLIESA